MSQIATIIRVDDALDEYEGFFDHEWARNLLEELKPTKLSSAGFDLTATWKGISEARRFPWLMIQAVKAAVERALNFSSPFPSRVLNELISRIGSGLEKNTLSLSSSDREPLCSEIRAIESQMSERSKVPIQLNPHDLWSHFLQNQGIALSLLMSETNSYAAV